MVDFKTQPSQNKLSGTNILVQQFGLLDEKLAWIITKLVVYNLFPNKYFEFRKILKKKPLLTLVDEVENEFQIYCLML